MSEAIVVAFITGSMTLAGTILTIILTTRKSEQAMATKLAVAETKIDNLTNEVRTHNEFAQRVPKLEGRVDALSDRLKSIENNLK